MKERKETPNLDAVQPKTVRPAAKKNYDAPQLKVHGSVAKMTLVT